MNLTVIVPAFNESAYLPATLDAIESAATHVRARFGVQVDTVVVDNNSTDDTAAVARSKGAVVVHEPVQGIALARNAGAHHAHGDVLVFVDADTLVPPTLLEAIRDTMSDPACVGGGVDVECQPRRRFTRLYLRGWRVLARCMGDGAGSDSVLPEGCPRTGRRLRRAGVDRRGRRFLPGPSAMRQGERRHGAVHRAALRAGALSPLRQVAAVEDAALDEPALHRAVPPPQGVLDRLVPASGAVGCRAGVTLPRNTPWRGHV